MGDRGGGHGDRGQVRGTDGTCEWYGLGRHFQGALTLSVFCIADKELVVCGTALRDFVSIVDTVGGRKEQGRAR